MSAQVIMRECHPALIMPAPSPGRFGGHRRHNHGHTSTNTKLENRSRVNRGFLTPPHLRRELAATTVDEGNKPFACCPHGEHIHGFRRRRARGAIG